MKKKFNNKGVGLIILTAVILAIGIIIAILLEYLNIDLALTKNQKTKNKLKDIREAIEIFVLENGRFPCPASFTDVPEDDNFGVEQRDGDECDDSNAGIFLDGTPAPNRYYGTIPVRTIGLADHYMVDKWNNKMGYVISSSFTGDNSFNDALEEGTEGDLVAGDISDAVYLMISFGKDSTGAYNMNSSFASGTASPNVISDDFDSFSSSDDDIMIAGDKSSVVQTNPEEREFCEAESSVSVPLYDADETENGTTSMDFPKTGFGKTAYSDENCPIIISSPVDADDEYYVGYDAVGDGTPNVINKIGRICGADGVWDSGFIGVCKALSKCTTPTTIGGRAITWDTTPPATVVETGEISGTFDDTSSAFTIQCVDGTFYATAGMDCDTASMSDYGNATWDEGRTYAEDEVATATGCQSGYTENPSGASTMTCSASGWTGLANPCISACNQTSPVYNIDGTQIMHTSLDGVIYWGNSPSNFSYVASCKDPLDACTADITGGFELAYGEAARCAQSCGSIGAKEFICSIDGSDNPIWKYQVEACPYSTASISNGTFTDPEQTAIRETFELAGTCDSTYEGTITTECQTDGTWTNTGSCTPATCDQTSPVYNIDGTQIMHTSLDGAIYWGYSPSSFAYIESCKDPLDVCTADITGGFELEYGEAARCAQACGSIGAKEFICSVDGSNNPIWKYQVEACPYSTASISNGTFTDPGQTAIRETFELAGTCDSGYSDGGTAITTECQTDGTWTNTGQCYQDCPTTNIYIGSGGTPYFGPCGGENCTDCIECSCSRSWGFDCTGAFIGWPSIPISLTGGVHGTIRNTENYNYENEDNWPDAWGLFCLQEYRSRLYLDAICDDGTWKATGVYPARCEIHYRDRT